MVQKNFSNRENQVDVAIALNVLYVKKEKIYPAYVSKKKAIYTFNSNNF